MPSLEVVLIALIGPGGLIGGIFLWLKSRNQDKATKGLTDAQALKVLQEAAVAMVDPLNDTISALTAQVEAARKEIERLREWLQLTFTLLDDKGIPRPPAPPPT